MSHFCPGCGRKNSDRELHCPECGHAPAEKLQGTAPPKLIDNRYEILSTIKAGGMGCVYKARDTRLDYPLALKQLIPPGDGDFAYALERFREEARILSTLNHPGLPKVTDFFSIPENENGGNAFYLAMTFIDGDDIETLMERRGRKPFSPDEMLPVFSQVLSILDYLHTRTPPIIYRDLNPRNVMLSGKKVFLIDFGIARLFTPRKKATVIGTPGYAAPEQYRGDAEPRSDIYSLGVMTHYLLTGQDPEGSERTLFAFEKPSALNPLVPGLLDDLILSMVDVLPEKRPASAAAILKLLEPSPGLPKDGDMTGNLSIHRVQAGTSRSFQYNSLYEAVEKLDYGAVQDFLAEKTEVNMKKSNGWTPLHSAVYHGDLRMTRVLVAAGARVDSPRSDGWTPLHLAAYHGHHEIASLLMEHGAGVNVKKDDGGMPLHLAAQGGHLELAGLLIDREARIDEKNDEGQTPLHVAACFGHEDIARLLLERGASAGLRDREGRTPLQVARTYSHDGVARIIRKSGSSTWWKFF